ncbi:MAG: haloacid dehalogenase [Anaerolineae bacterium]
MENLQAIIETINDAFEAKNTIRDKTLSRSRQLVRHCANAIRAIHRGHWEDADTLLATAREAATEMIEEVSAYPDLYFAGYTQDALKELAEAHLTLALVTDQALPAPESLAVEYPAYLNGLAEAMGELRRFSLDALRRGDVATSEHLLQKMDDVYSWLITVDFPGAITGGLRRNTDMVRGVLERTRGDVTTATRQEAMKAMLSEFERGLQS